MNDTQITNNKLFEIEIDTHDIIIQYDVDSNEWLAIKEESEEEDYEEIIIQENGEIIEWDYLDLFNGFVLSISDFNSMKEAYNNLTI